MSGFPIVAIVPISTLEKRHKEKKPLLDVSLRKDAKLAKNTALFVDTNLLCPNKNQEIVRHVPLFRWKKAANTSGARIVRGIANPATPADKDKRNEYEGMKTMFTMKGSDMPAVVNVMSQIDKEFAAGFAKIAKTKEVANFKSKLGAPTTKPRIRYEYEKSDKDGNKVMEKTEDPGVDILIGLGCWTTTIYKEMKNKPRTMILDANDLDERGKAKPHDIMTRMANPKLDGDNDESKRLRNELYTELYELFNDGSFITDIVFYNDKTTWNLKGGSMHWLAYEVTIDHHDNSEPDEYVDDDDADAAAALKGETADDAAATDAVEYDDDDAEAADADADAADDADADADADAEAADAEAADAVDADADAEAADDADADDAEPEPEPEPEVEPEPEPEPEPVKPPKKVVAKTPAKPAAAKPAAAKPAKPVAETAAKPAKPVAAKPVAAKPAAAAPVAAKPAAAKKKPAAKTAKGALADM